MAKYKFENEEGTTVKDLETGQSGIHHGVWLWRKYQEWLKVGGNVTEPYKTEDELAEDLVEEERHALIEARLQELEAERETGGMKEMSVHQARQWISAQFENITTLEELVAANKKVWLKATPYLLPKE